MSHNHPSILIKVIACGEEQVLTTFKHEYRSLMALLNDKLYLEGFGECGGQGRCATCLVEIKDGKHLKSMDRNEQATLSRLGIDNASQHLSCQLLIDETLHQVTVII
jgi:2Fe-2S ferredoxin